MYFFQFTVAHLQAVEDLARGASMASLIPSPWSLKSGTKNRQVHPKALAQESSLVARWVRWASNRRVL